VFIHTPSVLHFLYHPYSQRFKDPEFLSVEDIEMGFDAAQMKFYAPNEKQVEHLKRQIRAQAYQGWKKPYGSNAQNLFKFLDRDGSGSLEFR